MVLVAGVIFGRRMISNYYFPERSTTRTFCSRSLFSPQPDWFEYAMPSTTARGYVRCEDEWMSRNVM